MTSPTGSPPPAPAVSDQETLLAAAYLSRVAEPGSLHLWRLVQRLGFPDAAAAVRRGRAGPEVTRATAARRTSADPEADLAAAERNGIRLLVPASPQWPHFAMAALTGRGRSVEVDPGAAELIPPLALWVRGRWDLSAAGIRSLAVVGSRAATAYGEHVASDFAYALAGEGVAVVSGGAYGIDAAAHRGALAAEGISVLVSAAGLDRPYPAGHASLYERVAERGLLVSEHPPGSAPHRHRFLSRNRLIAAFGTATLVVEAGLRSGALNTARHARQLGRPVLAVPGPITSAMSVGGHRLLQRVDDPAHLVSSVAEVLGFCGGAGGLATAAAADAERAPESGYDRLGPVQRRLIDGLPATGVVSMRRWAQLSGVPAPVIAAALTELIEAGLVAAEAGGYRLAAAGSGVAG